jgi:hypothetical protein
MGLGCNPLDPTSWLDCITEAWDALRGHAGDISMVSGDLAVIAAGLGLEPAVPVLASISAVTGAIAAADAASQGDQLRAAIDLLGSLLGAGSLGSLAIAEDLEIAAREVWDAGELALAQINAHGAENMQGISKNLDMVTASLATISDVLEHLKQEC